MFKKILALHTGGTISMAADDSGAVITNEIKYNILAQYKTELTVARRCRVGF